MDCTCPYTATVANVNKFLHCAYCFGCFLTVYSLLDVVDITEMSMQTDNMLEKLENEELEIVSSI